MFKTDAIRQSVGLFNEPLQCVAQTEENGEASGVAFGHTLFLLRL